MQHVVRVRAKPPRVGSGNFDPTVYPVNEKMGEDLALGCFLRIVGENDSQRVRLGMGPRGDELFPTGEEVERAGRQAERAAKDVALQRVMELEAALRERRPRRKRER